MRRPDASIMANPMLVGTTTLLTVLVALFITYNANNGLPFVPTYNVRAVLSDAALPAARADAVQPARALLPQRVVDDQRGRRERQLVPLPAAAEHARRVLQ